MRRHHASRGQAVFETAIAMPLFLLGLFGLFWTMKESSIAEGVQQGVRYGGMVSSVADVYASFSLYTMYAAIDNSSPAAAQPCYGGLPDAVTNELFNGRETFWQATTAAPTQATCPSSLAIVYSPETYSQRILLRNDYATLSATLPTGGYLASAAMHGATSTSVQAAQNFFRSPDVGTLLNCSTLGAAVKASLEGMTDTTTPTTAATPLPTSLTPSVVISGTVATSCASPSTALYAAPTAPY